MTANSLESEIIKLLISSVKLWSYVFTQQNTDYDM